MPAMSATRSAELVVKLLLPREGQHALGERRAAPAPFERAGDQVLRADRRRGSASSGARGCPSTAISRLLKSWATPPVSWPIDSIFCDCNSCSWVRSRAATSAVSSAVRTAAAAEITARAAARGVDVGNLLAKLATRADNARAYDSSWRRYVRPVTGIEDLRLAPFHLMASEGAVHTDKPHAWHMAVMAELAAVNTGLLLATPYRLVDITDAHGACPCARRARLPSGGRARRRSLDPRDEAAHAPRS